MGNSAREYTMLTMRIFPKVFVLAILLAALPIALPEDRRQIVFSRLGPTVTGLFLADPDGRNERPLLPATNLDYNASFSADGKWIVFTSERAGSSDIHRVRPDGSGLERLTDSPAYDDQGTLSPDGRTLAFVSTRENGAADIWLLDLPTRRYRNLTNHRSGNFRPSWSPDGQWIAFTSDRDTKPGRAEPHWELLQSTAVYIVRPDGSGLRRLTELGGYAGSPKWSEDGRRIVFYQSTPKDVFPGRENGKATSQIFSIDIGSGAQKQHTSGPGFRLSPQFLDGDEIGYVLKFGEKPGLAFTSGRNAASGQMRHPAWSPGGKTLVYQKTVAEERSGVRPVFNRDPEFDLFRVNSFPAYSPAGDKIATTPSRPVLAVMDADGSNARTIFEAPGKVIVFPTWSPDGKHIAFAMGGFFARPVEPGQLAMIRSDGSDLRTLTKGEASSGFPSWSPDGKRIVYRVMGKGEQGLRILSLEDGKVTTLTKEYDTFPVWSPKGDRIAFTSFRDGDYEMYTIAPDGSGARKLTNTRGNDSHAIWSPDGKWIVFSSSRTGWKDEAMLFDRGPQPYGELFAMQPDGSGARQLTDNQWEDATPAWRPVVKRATK
jgi:TolB protein